MNDLQPTIAAAIAAGAQGIWLLNGASPRVEFAAPPTDEGDEADMRALDVQDAGCVLVIRLYPGPAEAHDYGLITLQPAAGYCRVCGCSQFNACDTGLDACHWVEPDLCSACAHRPFGAAWPAQRAQILARLAELNPDHPWLKEEMHDRS